MGRPLKRWPDYALESAENALALLKEIDRDTRAVQVAISEKDAVAALLLLSDVRAASLKAIDHIVRARSGNYEKEKPAWTQSEPTQREKAMAR